MNLYLIRHTQTNAPSGICYGQTDVDTAESFAAEAEIIRTNLHSLVFTHYFSSPLHRCLKLAVTLFPEEKINTDERLKELNFGRWEMLPWSEISEQEDAGHWFKDYLHIPCPDGESFEQLQDRIQSFVQDLKQLPEDSNVLVITHAGCIRAFHSLLEGIAPSTLFNQMVDFGALRKITFNPYEK